MRCFPSHAVLAIHVHSLLQIDISTLRHTIPEVFDTSLDLLLCDLLAPDAAIELLVKFMIIVQVILDAPLLHNTVDETRFSARSLAASL